MDKMERLESRILLGAVMLMAITLLVIVVVLISMSPEERYKLDLEIERQLENDAAFGRETSGEDVHGGACCCFAPLIVWTHSFSDQHLTKDRTYYKSPNQPRSCYSAWAG